MLNPVGIIDVATFIPKKRMTASHLIQNYSVPKGFLEDKIGLTEKPIASLNETPSDLGLQAVQKLIQRGSLDPQQIDLIIYASSGLFDYQFWSPAARIQQEIGAKHSLCFEVNNGCNAGNLCLNLITSSLKGGMQGKQALLVVSDTLSKFVDHSNPDSYHLANFSDGAAAILIGSQDVQFFLKSHCFITESKFLNRYRVLQGGTVNLREENTRKSIVPHKPIDDSSESLGEAYVRNYAHCIQKALSQADLSVNEIDYLFMNQGDRNLIKKIQDRFQIGEEKMKNTYSTFGHMGGADTFYALESLMVENSLSNGGHVVIGTSSIGFTWGASVLMAAQRFPRRKAS